MKVSELGEFGLIKRLIQRLQSARGGTDNAPPGMRLLVDVGDDAAAWQMGDIIELFTTDTVVDGVHFTRQTMPWKDLGWKAMAANVSDIAAMGGLPTYALITLGLPKEAFVEEVDDLYEGFAEICAEYGVRIIGGDIVGSPVAFVTISLMGVTDRQPLLRSAARPGDQVAVTGWLGASRGGLELLQRGGIDMTAASAAALVGAHRRPRPRIEAGRALSKAGVRAAMDVSDGLLDDLGKLCEASGLASVLHLESVPAHPALKEAFPEQCRAFALGGGEDYELLFTAPPRVMERALPLVAAGATVIGEVVEGTPGSVTLLGADGRPVALPDGGWDHFA